MILLLIVAALQSSQAEPLRAPPIDQCGDDPTFVEYREKLAGAIALKDADALRPLVDLNIKTSLGPDGDDGWPGFVRDWNLDRPADSELWLELSEVLSLGCSVYDGMKLMPMSFDIGEVDGSYPYWAIEKGAALRSLPDDTAPVVMQLENHVLIEIVDDEWNSVPEGWLHARLTNGQSGYVRLTAVRNVIDLRASFEKRDGKWVMTSFLGGD
jgi:hypothetical protein